MMGASTSEWLNTAGTAQLLGVTPRTVYTFVNDGSLPGYRFGRVIRFKRSDVLDFIEGCRIEPGRLGSSSLGS